MSRAPGWPAAAADLIAAAGRRPARLWQVTLAALAGNLLLHQLPQLPSPALTLVLSLAALAALVVAGPRTACLPSIALLAFCGTAFVAREALATRWPAAADGQDLALRGWIDDLPRREPGRTVFSLRVADDDAAADVVADGTAAANPDRDPDDPAPPRRVRLSWYDPAPVLVAGQSLEIVARLRSPRGLVNPGGFDYERWLYLEGFDATGYVREGRVVDDNRPGLAQGWLRFRAGLIERLGARIPDGDARALVLALSLGEYVGFEDRHWAAMQATGTSHLVSVSGLHIAIIAGLSFWVLLRLALRLPYRLARHALVIAAASSLVPATVYAALAGFALPTQRSLVMLLVAQILVVARRRWPLGGALGMALVAVLALDPAASLTASFWLSFVAVALLLIAALGARGAAGSIGTSTGTGSGTGTSTGTAAGTGARTLAWIADFGRVQWALTLGLIPLGLWYFGQFSIASFAVNFAAIPLFSVLVVPLCLVSALVAATGLPDPWLTPITAEVARLAWDGIELAAATPFAAVALPKPPFAEVLLASVAIALALPWHPLPGRRLLLLGLVPLFLPSADRLRTGELSVTVLDVGQGLAVAIETRSYRALYDAGPLYRSGFDAGAEIVGPALEALGARRLDRLIVSHADADHAGGLDAILLRHPEAVLLAGPDVLHPAAVPCRAGDRWVWDAVTFTVLHPEPGFGPPGNETSCVLRIDAAQGSVLLTGDIERQAEAGLARTADVRADVVVVPHHGSRTSSTPAFVARVAARLAIVSAGHNNRWGFPLPEVRDRWEASGARLLVTGEAGAIDVRFGPGGIEFGAARARRHRYWQAVGAPVSGTGGGSAL